MSDILIPIKEFPRCCGLCPCLHAEHHVYCQADKTLDIGRPYGERHKDCPLIELAEHGDLIDKQGLAKSYDCIKPKDSVGREQYDTLMGYEVYRMIENAPVILPSNRVST